MYNKRRNDGIYALWEWCTYKTLAPKEENFIYKRSKTLIIKKNVRQFDRLLILKNLFVWNNVNIDENVFYDDDIMNAI